jgi:hypothetical protein
VPRTPPVPDPYRQPEPEPEPYVPPRYREERDEPEDRDNYRPVNTLGCSAVISLSVWIATIVVAAVVGLLWLAMMSGAEGAIQEAAASAMAAAWLIGVYVVARSVEKILAVVGTMRSR